jgi:alkylhydroperoxidase family enzyme
VTGTNAPRLAPLPADEWDDEVRAALRTGFPQAADRFLSTGPDAMRTPNAVGTLLRHPALAGRFLAYNSVLLFAPALAPRLRELMVLRVAWRTRCNYEWAQHLRLAQNCDITPNELDAIEQGAAADEWSPLERDLLAATDQLIDRYRIDDATWARLAEELDDRQLVEVVFVVGTYTCLAMAFNSFGLQLDPDLQTTATRSLPDSQE